MNKSFARVAIFLPIAVVAINARPAFAQQSSSVHGGVIESHNGLTVAAKPWTDPDDYNSLFPKKKSPLGAGVLAIQVAFRNDLDENVKVNLSRMQLILEPTSSPRLNLFAMTSEDVADAVRNPGIRNLPDAPKKSKAKGWGWRDKQWFKIKQITQESQPETEIVPPHRVLKGVLYFDLHGDFRLMDTAHLYIPDAVATHSNQQFLYFDMDLSQTSKALRKLTHPSH